LIVSGHLSEKTQPLASFSRDTPPDDPLLDCLAFLAEIFDQPFSREMALAGIPLREDRLSVDLFARTAARLGLHAKLAERSIAKVPGIVTPFVVLFENGDAGIVTSKKSGSSKLEIVFPSQSNKPRKVRVKDLEAESSGYIFYVTHQAQPLSEKENSGARRGHWLWTPVLNFKGAWTQVAFAALAINILGLALPLFIMNVYDRVIPNLVVPTLWALAAGVALALFFDFLLKQLRALLLDGTGRRVDMAVGSSLFEHVLALPMRARLSASGSVASQFRDFESVRDFFTSSSIIAVTDFLFIGIFLGVLWLVVGPVAWVPALAVPVVIFATLLAQIPMMKAITGSQIHGATRHNTLVEALVGIETVKAVGGEAKFQRQWEDATAGLARAHSKARFWSSFVVNFSSLIQQSVSVIIVIAGVFLVIAGDITIGGLIAANILAGRVLAPLGNIAQTLARAQQAFAAVRSLNGLMNTPAEGAETSRGAQHVVKGAVEFRDVSFSYPNVKTPTLESVNLNIRAGEAVGIIGRVGSGKTTLGRLICGLYFPQKGNILIDGAEIRQFSPADLRAGVGYVSQDPELFTGTLRSNITLGCRDAGEDDINWAVTLAGVDKFTADHPLGLDLPVGERGRTLSGGQRQAVALARALLRRPKIIFLDEPSGAMDLGSEKLLIARLGEITAAGVTLLVSTHRGALLDAVDRLVVIEAGRVATDGPKDKVLAALQKHAERVSDAPGGTRPEGSEAE